MFIPSRNVWHPLGRAPRKQAPSPEPPEPTQFDEKPDLDPDPNAWDEADALAAMPDADFYQSLRQDITGVREGSIPSIVAEQRPSPKDRPWSKRHKIRDRRGVAY